MAEFFFGNPSPPRILHRARSPTDRPGGWSKKSPSDMVIVLTVYFRTSTTPRNCSTKREGIGQSRGVSGVSKRSKTLVALEGTKCKKHEHDLSDSRHHHHLHQHNQSPNCCQEPGKQFAQGLPRSCTAVSYTHLTLPTKRIV